MAARSGAKREVFGRVKSILKTLISNDLKKKLSWVPNQQNKGKNPNC
jgi:hypothetical protein